MNITCMRWYLVLVLLIILSFPAAGQIPPYPFTNDIECGLEGVWSTMGGNLFLFDIEAGMVTEITFDPLYTGDNVSLITRGPDNALWFSVVDTLLLRYDGVTKSKHTISEFGYIAEESPPIRDVQFHNDETWLIFTDKLLQYSDDSYIFYKPVPHWPGESYRPVYDVAFDTNGTAWTIGRGGLAYANPADSSMVEDSRFRGAGQKILIDEQGRFWIGGYRGPSYDISKEPTGWLDDPGGLVIIDGDKITRYTTENSGIPSNTIWDFEYDASGTLWLATEKGVASFDGETWHAYDADDCWVFGIDPVIFCVDIDDNTKWFGTRGYGVLSFDGTTWDRYIPEAGPMTVIEEEDAAPAPIELAPAFPNPFNPATTISFTLPDAAPVTLAVYNLNGQKVATLMDGPVGAGAHEVVFDGSGLASGVYVYHLDSPGYSNTGKMLLVK